MDHDFYMTLGWLLAKWENFKERYPNYKNQTLWSDVPAMPAMQELFSALERFESAIVKRREDV